MEADKQQHDSGCFKVPDLPLPSKPVSFQLVPSRKVVSSQLQPDSTKPTESAAEDNGPCATANKASLPPDKVEPVPYLLPVWSGVPECSSYFMEVIKNGCIVDTVCLADKPYYVFGRLPNCDIQLDHPSVSRHQAVCQYRAIGDDWEKGWYLYDLGSTHGSFVNKEKIPPHMHIRLKVGYVVKFACSSRIYVLQGPGEDAEEESSLTVSKAKELANKQKLLMNLPKQSKSTTEKMPTTTGNEERQPDGSQEAINGIDWGISDDYDEDEQEEEEEEADQATYFDELQKREQFYINDPKKALKNFFDREDQEMNFEFVEKSGGFQHQWTCSIELPVESQTGKPVFATATVTGSKKDAMAACALDACRLLDAAGVLRRGAKESRRRKNKDWEADDFYDSDEDTFLDRTGEVERKRQKRMQREKSDSGKPETYSSLSDKLDAVQNEIERVKRQIGLLSAETLKAASTATGSNAPSSRDSLDDYMFRMSNCDAHQAKLEQSRLRVRLVELDKQEKRLQRLVNLAKPAQMPALRRLEPGSVNKFKKPVFIGSIKAPQKLRQIEMPVVHRDQAAAPEGEVEEFEEEEEDEKQKKTKKEETEKKMEARSKPRADSASIHSEAVSSSDDVQPSKSEVDVLGTTVNQAHVSSPSRPEVSSEACVSSTTGSPPSPTTDESRATISKDTNPHDKVYSVVLPSEPIQKTLKKQKDISEAEPASNELSKMKKYMDTTTDSFDPDYAAWLPPEISEKDRSRSGAS